MGRIQRMVIAAETHGYRLDLGTTGTGKLFLQNEGDNDLVVSYIPNDAAGGAIDTGSIANQYYTIYAGQAYSFDLSPSTGFLVQDQQMYFYSQGGTTVAIWITGGR